MSSKTQARGPSSHRVIFDGQSLNNHPVGANYPKIVMQGKGIPWRSVAEDGVSWTQLATTAAARSYRQAVAETSILVMCGGTSDIFFENNSAAVVYSDMVSYANKARDGGYDIIIGVTITHSTWFDNFPVMHTRRADANTLIIADASNAFDAVADFAGGPTLSIKSSSAYVDGTHYSESGAIEAAGILAPILEPFLP